MKRILFSVIIAVLAVVGVTTGLAHAAPSLDVITGPSPSPMQQTSTLSILCDVPEVIGSNCSAQCDVTDNETLLSAWYVTATDVPSGLSLTGTMTAVYPDLYPSDSRPCLPEVDNVNHIWTWNDSSCEPIVGWRNSAVRGEIEHAPGFTASVAPCAVILTVSGDTGVERRPGGVPDNQSWTYGNYTPPGTRICIIPSDAQKTPHQAAHCQHLSP